MCGAGLEIIRQAVGSGTLQVRPECGSLGHADEHGRLGCPSSVSAPGEEKPGDQASANATSLAASMSTLISNFICRSISHKWKEL